METTAQRLRRLYAHEAKRHADAARARRPWGFTSWAEVLGDPTCPYMTRWVLNLRVCTLRLHCFHRSDSDRHLHDHPWWFFSLLLRGSYREFIRVGGPAEAPDVWVTGWRHPLSVAFRPALTAHRVEIADGRNTWTFCVSGPQRRQWGFWEGLRFFPSRAYFGLFGHPPCKDR